MALSRRARSLARVRNYRLRNRVGSAGLAMKLYDELAEWWPLFSAPEDYAEEAAYFARVLTEACKPAPRTVLELGSGGGNNALYLKSQFQMTLVDLSPQKRAVRRALNSECEPCAAH